MPLLTRTARTQHAAKVATIARWLSTWRYSAPPVLAALLRLKHVHHLTPLLNTLEERDVLVRYTGFRAYPRIPLYTLAPGSAGLFPTLSLREPIAPAHLERVRRSPIVQHDLSLQHYVAQLPDPLEVMPSGRAEPGAMTPDAYVPNGAGRIAIELERTVKNVPRIFRGLVAHADAIERGDYHGVRYVFASRDKRQAYLERFRVEAWPRFHYFSDTKRYAPIGDAVLVDSAHPVRAHFAFEVVSLWPSLI